MPFSYFQFLHFLTSRSFFFIQFGRSQPSTTKLPPLPTLSEFPRSTATVTLCSQASDISIAPSEDITQASQASNVSFKSPKSAKVEEAMSIQQVEGLLKDLNEKANKSESKTPLRLYTDYVHSVLEQCDFNLRQDAQHDITQIINRCERLINTKNTQKPSPFKVLNTPDKKIASDDDSLFNDDD